MIYTKTNSVDLIKSEVKVTKRFRELAERIPRLKAWEFKFIRCEVFVVDKNGHEFFMQFDKPLN